MGWIDACPLDGRCSECGLAFRWMDLLSRRHSLPRWSVEAGPGFWEWVLRWPRQHVMAAVRPLHVHRRLRMEHLRRPWRLAATLVPLLVVAALVPLVVTGMRSWRAGMPPNLVVLDALEPWRSEPSTVLVPLAAARRPGFIWLLNVDGTWTEREASVALIDRPAVAPERVAFVRRFGGERLVRVALPGGVNLLVETDAAGVVPPANVTIVQAPIMVPRTGPSPRSLAAAWGERLVTFALPVVAVPIAAAAAFIVLPVVRHRARVSAGHIVRLMLLGLLLAVTISGLLAWMSIRRDWPTGSALLVRRAEAGGGFRFDRDLIMRVGGPVALAAIVSFVWIRSAAVHHLRLDRPVAVAAATSAVSITAASTLWFLLLLAL